MRFMRVRLRLNCAAAAVKCLDRTPVLFDVKEKFLRQGRSLGFGQLLLSRVSRLFDDISRRNQSLPA